MFKPHYGICICHNKKRLIVVKKGFCKQGNDERKGNIRGENTRTSKESIQKRIDGTRKVVLGSIRDNGSKDKKANIRSSKKNIQPFGRRKVSSKNVDEESEKTKQVFHRKKGIVRKKKVTGERVVFEEILEERGRYSQISVQYLGEGFNPWWFSHCVPKSIAPGLRLDKRNIILKTPDEHATWENKKHTIRDDPKWKWVFELEEKLKQEYCGQGKTKG